MDQFYRSTELYTVEKVTDSTNSAINQVTNSQGMVTARLTDEEFANQFEPIE
jgi:hypothetical protein